MPMHGQAVGFLLTFAAIVCVLLGCYYFPYPEGSTIKAGIDSYLHGYARVAGTVLHWFDSTVRVQGNEITGRYSMRIVRTCDAMDVKILFASAVLAWPAIWRRRVIAAIVGVLLLFAINVARICALYYIGIAAPSYFRFAHHELLPVLILAVTVGAFIIFTAWDQRTTPLPKRHETA